MGKTLRSQVQAPPPIKQHTATRTRCARFKWRKRMHRFRVCFLLIVCNHVTTTTTAHGQQPWLWLRARLAGPGGLCSKRHLCPHWRYVWGRRAAGPRPLTSPATHPAIKKIIIKWSKRPEAWFLTSPRCVLLAGLNNRHRLVKWNWACL